MIRLITLIALAISSVVFSQDLSGRATYQTKMIFKNFDMKSSDNKDSGLSPEIMKQFEEAMKKSSEKTYFLEFTKNESSYTEEEKLEQPTAGGNRVSISFNASGSGKLYKNLKENYSILENDYLGKDFLIKDSLHTSGWELSSESKQVGNYTVYKATKTVKPKNLFSDDEDKVKEDLDEKSSGLLSMIDKKPEDVVYTAWYTPEIPIANGPETFGGLPGLILELHTPNMVYLCSEIVLNPKKAIKIKTPKGKTISQKEYDDMLKKQFESMPKTKDGKGRISVQSIQIGG